MMIQEMLSDSEVQELYGALKRLEETAKEIEDTIERAASDIEHQAKIRLRYRLRTVIRAAMAISQLIGETEDELETIERIAARILESGDANLRALDAPAMSVRAVLRLVRAIAKFPMMVEHVRSLSGIRGVIQALRESRGK